jgi:hypothetical protein
LEDQISITLSDRRLRKTGETGAKLFQSLRETRDISSAKDKQKNPAKLSESLRETRGISPAKHK